MHLTSFTDVGLRILIALAVKETEAGRGSTRDIAEAMGVSYTHATKACAHLAAQGWVDTERGRGGGVSLTEAGRVARVGDVVRSLEFDAQPELIDCEGLQCPLRSGCRLRSALARAQAAFYAELNDLTIGELGQPPTRPIVLALTNR